MGGLVFVWIAFSLLVGMLGSGKKIGFAGVFVISLLLSPIVGVIVAVVSEDDE